MATEHLEIESYLRRLRLALGPLPSEERQEICRELRSHLHERATEGDAALATAFATLGPPETYARAFHDDYQLSVAIATGSTRKLFAQGYRLAGRSLWGAAVFLVLFSLFALATGLILVALIKPLLPQHVGLWLLDTGGFIFGLASSDTIAGSEEALGWWFVPVSLATGLLFWTLASRVLRWFVATFRRS